MFAGLDLLDSIVWYYCTFEFQNSNYRLTLFAKDEGIPLLLLAYEVAAASFELRSLR